MEAAKWVALAVGVVGMALFFTDLIVNIRHRNHTRLNVTGLVFLSLSFLCFVLTQFVFYEGLPPVFSYFWIFFLAAYFVCDVILAVSLARQNKQNKKVQEKNSSDDIFDETTKQR